MPFTATWMNLEIIIVSEVSQTKKDKCYMIPSICEIQKTCLYNRIRLTGIENKLMVTKEEGGMDKLGVWD